MKTETDIEILYNKLERAEMLKDSARHRTRQYMSYCLELEARLKSVYRLISEKWEKDLDVSSGFFVYNLYIPELGDYQIIADCDDHALCQASLKARSIATTLGNSDLADKIMEISTITNYDGAVLGKTNLPALTLDEMAVVTS